MRDTFLKSVHITNYYHKNSGGISTSYNNLLAAAELQKRYVRLIVPGEFDSVEDVNAFARIYYVPARYSPLIDRRYRVMMPWQYMLKDSVIRRILLDERPDIIEVTDKYTLSFIGPMIRTNSFKKLGRPILVHFSCERMDDNIASFLTSGKIGKWIARRVMGNYILPSFDFHIANSAYTAEEFYESYRTVDNPKRSKWLFKKCWQMLKAPRVPIAERIFVCPRGVDGEQFSPDRRSAEFRQSMREQAHVPSDSIILLYAGRISPEKNIGLLVDMMKALSRDAIHDFRLLIAGAGPQSEWLKQQGAKVAPGKIVQLGHLDKKTLADYYSNAEVFVHPNPKEPFGNGPLEAMASGLPTVAPNTGGVLSYATNENAWIVEPDGRSFAAAIREIIENESLRNEKVEKALQTASVNTRDVSTDRQFATYDKIYLDFSDRRELFVDREASRNFDFISLANA